jgi:endonuclease/exonuclease/phosphatase family metal-dependent hydrolase
LLAALALGCTMEYEMGPRPRDSGCAAESYAAAVDWYAPARTGDQETLAEWCSTVGPPVIDALPSTDFADAPGSDTLTVVTWNLHGGSGDLLSFIESELDLSCSDAPPVIGDSFEHFVLVLQEVYRRSDEVPLLGAGSTVPGPLRERARSGERLDVVELSGRCRLSLFYVPSMRNGDTEYEDGREDRGNAILSTLPLSDPVAIELPFEAQRRVAAAATVHGPGGDGLRLVSVHLDVASSMLRVLHTGNSTRQRQGLGLLDALVELEATRADPTGDRRLMDCYPECPPGSPPRYGIATLAAGDFNSWSARETVIKHFERRFPQSPAWDGLPTRSSYPADYIFFRESAEGRVRLIEGSQRRLDDRHGSDHFARIVRLVFTR